MEDQGMMGRLLSIVPEEHEPNRILAASPHIPFFPAETVGQLLTKIENLLPQSEPIAQTVDVPLSPELQRVFEGAEDLRNMFHHEQIKPLHLLAAVLTDESSQYAKLLQGVAIKKEEVLKKLRLKLDEEQRQLSHELAKAINDALRESKRVAEVASKARAARLDISLHLNGTIKITRLAFPENPVPDRSVLESLLLATDFDESPKS
jgi:hypothetical protein